MLRIWRQSGRRLRAWEALVFMLNGLVFVLIGLQLPYVLAGIHGRYGTGTLIFYGAVFSAVLILLRMIWVFPAVKIASFVERRWLGHTDEEELKPREVFVVGWTGMRGVLALAAAISVPETFWDGRPFEARNLIVFLAFCVIFVTLVLQGLTLPALIRGLGLSGARGGEAGAGGCDGDGTGGEGGKEDCVEVGDSLSGRRTEDLP